MSDSGHSRNSTKTWIAIGAIILIIILLIWLTCASLAGDTDVAACLPPIH